MVFGEPIPGAWYAVALTNGTGQNLEEKQGNVQEVQAQGKDVTTRAVLDFAQLASVDNAILHFGVGYKTGMMANSPANPYFAPNARTEARGVTFFNPAPFNGTGGNVSNIRRSYWDAEMLLSYGPVKLSAEYWEANFAGTKTVGAASNGFAPKIDSWYVSAMWLVTGESYRDSYFDSVPQKIHPNNNFVLGKNGGWGAWEIGARYSVFDASDFNQGTNAFTGQLGATASGTTPVISVSTNKATAYTAQIKWIQNTFTRTMLDYVVTRFDTPITDNGTPRTEERAIMMRFQVDI